MVNQSENTTENAEAQAASGAALEGATVASGSVAPKKRPRIIKSIFARTTLNYGFFALTLLVLFIAVFFAGMYIFYGDMMENDAMRIARSASVGLPKDISNGISNPYKYRLFEVARSNRPVAIAVFGEDEGGNVCISIVVDDMGNGTSDDSELFDSVIAKLNYNDVLSHGDVVTVDTPFGTYICTGSKQVDEGGLAAYLLVMKPYDIWDNQTIKVIYVLIACIIIVFGLACMFAFLASRHTTKYLKDFSQKAKHVAQGDYSVNFSGYGYSEYENLATALNAATQNIVATENLQRELIANVSHDIRTPLTMIRAYAEMLRDIPMKDDKRAKTANVIVGEVDRLTEFVVDVLNYSKLKSGAAEYDMQKCDISLVASDVLGRFDFLRERDGIKLIGDIDDGAVVTCDKTKIDQVIYNLVGNAVNYCGDDKTVILRVKNVERKVRVEVEDHGSGIDQKDLDSVWDRYYRSAHSTRTVVGSGLGLSICKTVLTAHGADFGVTSEPNKGSTFWFELDSCR